MQVNCFNSKRCDYEAEGKHFVVNALPVSIPKGAIMSFGCLLQTYLVPRFNSKRCDYER